MSRLTELLERLARRGGPVTMVYVFDLVRQERFTGQIMLHFQDGRLRQIEAGRPIMVTIHPAEEGSSGGTGLDTSKPIGASSGV